MCNANKRLKRTKIKSNFRRLIGCYAFLGRLMKIFRHLLSVVIIFQISGCSDRIDEADCWALLDNVKSKREAGNIDLAFKEIAEISNCLASINVQKGMRYYYHLGWLYYEDGEFEKAIEAYNMGLQDQPDYAFAFWKRGQAHEALGNIEKSIEDYKSAVRIGQETLPNFEQILIDYPDVKANLGKYVE
jgi:tetratricopeptide (TPR) repeat protein